MAPTFATSGIAGSCTSTEGIVVNKGGGCAPTSIVSGVAGANVAKEEGIAFNKGGTLALTFAPSGIVGTSTTK